MDYLRAFNRVYGGVGIWDVEIPLCISFAIAFKTKNILLFVFHAVMIP